jgi:YhcH/YjgK/YiaL family protein
MIVGSLDEVVQQCNRSALLQKAFEYLMSTESTEISDGVVEVDGSNIYAIIQSYTSSVLSHTLRFEAHRKYIDIQFLVTGKEVLGWAHLSKLKTTIPYSDNKDAVYGVVNPDDVSLVHYCAGQAVVLFPSDAHAPGLADELPESVKKIVMKVAVEEEV